jgi:hypothetical protein
MRAILTPGNGPNGPGPIDARRPVASVGLGSSVPYGATNGYAASDTGVTGFVGPAADSLRKPTLWYVRIGGSNDNGGTGTSLAAERTGTDGALTVSTSTFTSATGAFTSADVGKGLCVGTGTGAHRFKITAVNSSTSVELDRWSPTTLSGQTWALGGCWADIRPAVGDIAVSQNTSGATSAVNAGDTVYVGAGVYRAIINVSGAAWGRPSTMFAGINRLYPEFNGVVSVVGDVSGEKTGDAGEVQFTAYLTNDKTAPSGSPLFTAGGSGKGNMSFANIVWVGGSATMFSMSTSGAPNFTWTDCACFQGYTGNQSFVVVTAPYSAFLNWLFDRCYFGPSAAGNGFTFTLNSGGRGDYDVNVVFRNTMFFSAGDTICISVVKGLALASLGGGVKLVNVSCMNGGNFLKTSNTSLKFPCAVYNSFLQMNRSASLLWASGGTGEIVEAFNLMIANAPRTNVAVGAGSVSDGSYAPLYHVGQERIWGGTIRPYGEPSSSSPLLAFGHNEMLPSTDLRRGARPAGGASTRAAAGALERANTFAKNTSTVRTGANSISITGPGYQEFLVPVDASSTTISVYARYDSAYVGTRPQLQIDANGEIGVVAETAMFGSGASDADPGSGAWAKLQLTAFTPTASGVVKIRVISADASGAGQMFVDDFTIA